MTLLLFARPPAAADQPRLERWNLQRPPENSEHLRYRLAYRGILTAFVWKELAEVAFTASAAISQQAPEPACELVMSLTTENNGFAEYLRPTRYRWRSFSDPVLQRALLVEVKELTDDDREHRVSWIDWKRRRIELFRLRKRRTVPGFLGDWEADGTGEPDHRLLRTLLRDEPPPRKGERRMSWARAVPIGAAITRLLDPLGFLYAARWHDYGRGDLVAPVSYKKEIRTYRAHLLGREWLELDGVRHRVLKVEMRRRNDREAEEEGFMRVWFSDDSRRTPLRFVIDGFIGQIRLRILPESIARGSQPLPCVGPQQPALSGTSRFLLHSDPSPTLPSQGAALLSRSASFSRVGRR